MFTYAGAAGLNRWQRSWGVLRDHPSGVLLVVQLLGVLMFPFTDQGGVGRTVLSAFGLVVLAIAVLAVNRTPATRLVAWILGAPVFVLTVVEAFLPTHQGVQLVSYAFHAIFYFYTAVSLLRYMFADAWVSRDELFATGACFTVLAWAFAYTHGVVQILWPGSYVHDGPGDLTWMDLLFLSFTTLTGTGLSDIAPAATANHARSVLMLQMLAGMNYIALVVARLLGLTLVKFPEVTAPGTRGLLLPGLGLAAGLGLVAHLLGTQVPVVGGPVLGILLGLVVGTLLGPRPSLSPGTGFAAKKVLQAAVVLLGLGLSLGQVARIGWETLPVMLGTLVLALAAGPLIGRWLGVAEDIRTLVTVGTSICGASAIATVSAVTGATGAAIAVSIAVIFVYNALAVLFFPVLGHALGLSQEGFGLWAGTAVNDTSSVVAAATVYGAVATSHAVVVKLTRTLMIIPIAVGQSVARARRAADGEAGMPWSRLVPPFLILFLLAAGANSVGLVPASWGDPVRDVAGYLTTVALAAIGLSTPVRAVREASWRPLALGGVLWVLVAVSSLVLMRLTGHW